MSQVAPERTAKIQKKILTILLQQPNQPIDNDTVLKLLQDGDASVTDAEVGTALVYLQASGMVHGDGRSVYALVK